MSINLILLIFLNFLINKTITSSIDRNSFKDTLIIKSSRKFINFDIPNFELTSINSLSSFNKSSSKLICLQFKYVSTDNNEATLLKLYLINKKTNELCEKLWSSKLLFNGQKIYEELNIDTEILNDNSQDYQLQFRLLNNDDEINEQLSIEDILLINSVKITNDYCQSRHKCVKNDCLWNTFKNETLARNIVKLKSRSQLNLLDSTLINKLNLDLKDNNIYFLVNNKNKSQLNETIYSPVLKLPINLDQIGFSFDCRSVNTECLPNFNLFIEYKFADEFFNFDNSPKLLSEFNKQTYRNKLNNDKIDRFEFKLNAKNFIAKQVDIVFWISIKLKLNQTLVLSNIEIKNFLSPNLNWNKCDFKLQQQTYKKLNYEPFACNLEQLNSYDTKKVLKWSIENDRKIKKLSNFIILKNDQTSSHFPNELFLPRSQLSAGNNKDCVFKFKYYKQNSDFNLFVYFVDDHKRIVKIWEEKEDAFMYNSDDKSKWIEISIFLGNIYKGFRLSFSTEQLPVNSSVAISDLEFENCFYEQTNLLNKNKKPDDLDIIKISYQEPKLLNEQSIYKCNFEHTSAEDCGLYSDELIEETCLEELNCVQSEWIKSLDSIDGMNHLQLPFRDHTKNFGINGHYIYLQNMNSNGKMTRAMLRFKRTISNKLQDSMDNNLIKINSTRNYCKMKFYLRTNGYNLVNYDIFVDLITSNRLMQIKTEPKYSKLNFYELQVISFEDIDEPFQVLLQGTVGNVENLRQNNYLNQNTFIYIALDDLSFTEDCLFL